MSPDTDAATASENDLSLRCQCGKTRGVAFNCTPRTGTHATCYCDDCQTFGRFLESPNLLDEHGGTTVFQIPPARLRIVEGQDQIRCLRLSPKGLYRFYTACCHTPVGNMVGPRMPFVGITRPFFDHDDAFLETRLGPAHGVQGRFAQGTPPDGVDETVSPTFLAKSLGRIFFWWLGRKQRPSPFFDLKTGELSVPVSVLSLEERQRLRPTP